MPYLVGGGLKSDDAVAELGTDSERQSMILAIVGMLAGLAVGANAADFGDIAWSYRPLLIYARDAQDPRLAEQHRQLDGQEAGLLDRDMVVIEVIGDEVRSVFGPPVEDAAARLRALHRIDVGAFAVLLVGKDTGVKLRSNEPVAMEAVFRLIDGMPIRRREMGER